MSLPGFHAAASMYQTKEQYRTNGMRIASGQSSGVNLAQFAVFDPCAHCRFLPNPCARARCACICAGGDLIPVSPIISHCGFLCV
jgi:hypothetical protein